MSEDLPGAALELLEAALGSCENLEQVKQRSILSTTQELIFDGRG